METCELHAKVYGKVQMVMFRDFVQRKAQNLSLVGTVENLEDGSLEVCAQGEEAKLEQLIMHLHKGPFLARVLKVDVEWREPTKTYKGFSIVY